MSVPTDASPVTVPAARLTVIPEVVAGVGGRSSGRNRPAVDGVVAGADPTNTSLPVAAIQRIGEFGAAARLTPDQRVVADRRHRRRGPARCRSVLPAARVDVGTPRWMAVDARRSVAVMMSLPPPPSNVLNRVCMALPAIVLEFPVNPRPCRYRLMLDPTMPSTDRMRSLPTDLSAPVTIPAGEVDGDACPSRRCRPRRSRPAPPSMQIVSRVAIANTSLPVPPPSVYVPARPSPPLFPSLPSMIRCRRYR